MSVPVIGLFVFPKINPFHFSIPNMIFNLRIDDQPLFDLKIFSVDGQVVQTEYAMMIVPDTHIEQMDQFDMIIIPGWDDFNHVPDPKLITGLQQAYANGKIIVGLCYGTYALAYAGLLDHKKATTHWLAEQDFSQRFPHVQFDRNSLYVDDQRVITSAGTGAALDCCLYLIRGCYNTSIANKISRIMVIPPHREGGQAQFIEQPVAESSQDAQISLLLDFLRQNLNVQHRIEHLAERTHMTRRTFTRHFKKATGMTLMDWLTVERIRFAAQLLETTRLSIEKVSELAGFNNTVSFRTKFREKYNTSPQAWRKSFGIYD